MERTNVIYGAIFALLLIAYDFNTRVYIQAPALKEKSTVASVVNVGELKKIDIDNFLAANFSQLLAIESKELKAEQERLNKLKNKESTANSKNVNAKALEKRLRLIGILNKNGLQQAVFWLKSDKGASKVITLNEGDSFDGGKLMLIEESSATILMNQQQFVLPIFKNKTIKVQG